MGVYLINLPATARRLPPRFCLNHGVEMQKKENVVLSPRLRVSARSGRVVPIIPSPLSFVEAQRPHLEVRHFWHRLTPHYYESQHLRSQETHCAGLTRLIHYTRCK
ncbi:unnamed protein product [Pleuronectes platessa]|uniref:Uncharacterized protein n=1 Tax=Pleuronectes platessa TaxID=8262 RepID=A0A9N7W010_PLEPL|nr:unnamed protein product [Pleuronectes platessa]